MDWDGARRSGVGLMGLFFVVGMAWWWVGAGRWAAAAGLCLLACALGGSGWLVLGVWVYRVYWFRGCRFDGWINEYC